MSLSDCPMLPHEERVRRGVPPPNPGLELAEFHETEE